MIRHTSFRGDGMRGCWIAIIGAFICFQASAVTFSKDVAPVVYENCTMCHREGEAAPFPLVTYEDVRKHAKQIADVTFRHVMPPWKAEGREFLHARRLTDEQIAVIGQWVEQKCPAGDLSSAPKAPEFPAGWQLGEPDLIVKMAGPYRLVAEGRDVYRCFVIPVEIPAGKYVRAVEFRPGNRRIVHHALLTSLRKEEGIMRLGLLGDGKSFGSGLTAPGERLPGPLGIWTPGMEAQPLPEGFAHEWDKNCDLMVQLHLHPSGKVEAEQSSIGLYFTDKRPVSRLRSVVLFNPRVDIAAGEQGHAIDKTTTLKFPADAYGIFPHMHLIGRTVELTATFPDGSQRRLISIGDWDFNWQNYYQYARPIHLPAGTKLSAHWTYDNSAANPANPNVPPKRVTFGEQTTNEMAAVILDVIPAGAGKSLSLSKP
jgi:hypothetical protein